MTGLHTRIGRLGDLSCAVEARKQSREQLLGAIDAWGQVMRLEGFFADVERRIGTCPEELSASLLQRLAKAREVIGSVDALRHFQSWKTPEEMFEYLTANARRPW